MAHLVVPLVFTGPGNKQDLIIFLNALTSTLLFSGDFGADIELQNSGFLSCALAIEEGREFVVIGGYRHQHTDR